MGYGEREQGTGTWGMELKVGSVRAFWRRRSLEWNGKGEQALVASQIVGWMKDNSETPCACVCVYAVVYMFLCMCGACLWCACVCVCG